MARIFTVGSLLVILFELFIYVAPTCKSDEFVCANTKHCVPKRWRCDGDRDCPDGSDEKQCSTQKVNKTCSDDYYQCGNGACIQSHWVCDGDYDCYDKSDERNCSKY